jgi:hypothetical protein
MTLSNKRKSVGTLVEIWVYDDEDNSKDRKAYEIDKDARIVRYFPAESDSFDIDVITFEGFERLPSLMHENGYLRTSGLSYAFGKKLSDKKVKELNILQEGQAEFTELEHGLKMTIPYSELESLSERFKAIAAEAKSDRSIASSDLFSGMFPEIYETKEVSPGVRFARFSANLDTSMIKEMTREQIDWLFDFTARVMTEKYTSENYRNKLFEAAKIKIDTVALKEIISSFESMLENSHSEADWGIFLRKNLFLVESRYVNLVPELNLVLAKSRKVDFGMVDTHGYLDIFEIKKPNTPLLAKTTDRDNYYWSLDATKAIAQAEKYLWHAERKAPTLSEDLERQCKVQVEVNRPRAVLVMGSMSQLTSPEMQNDFRVLKSSLKNIEVVTYDELLERLKNQQSKIYSGT